MSDFRHTKTEAQNDKVASSDRNSLTFKMSSEAEPSTSSGNKSTEYQNGLNSTLQGQESVSRIRDWVLTEAEFNGRTDEEFLLIFIHGCKFDLEKVKKKMTAYYDNRRKFPKWLANRDLRDESLRSILELKLTTAVTNSYGDQPTVIITQLSRAVKFPFDDFVKHQSILVDVIMRRPNSQSNGVVAIIDCKNYPWWILKYFLSPFLVRDLINTFMLSNAVRIKSIHMINIANVTLGLWSIARPFIGSQIRDRVFFYHSDWPKLFEHVAVETVPREYGGLAEPMKQHEDAFLKEVLSHSEYFLDDNKYGFQTTKRKTEMTD